MKKSALYIAATMIIAGSLMWGNPMISHAEPEEASAEVTADSAIITVGEDESDEEGGPGAELERALEEEQAAAEAARAADKAAQAVVDARQNLVNYALQFVGCPYRAGGNDQRRGADWSGSGKFVLQRGAGITMNRSSRSQATQGRPISAAEIQPGDLVFYGNGSGINHVAMYIGNGQIVHASTYKTGIKISNWTYRAPIKIISMFG